MDNLERYSISFNKHVTKNTDKEILYMPNIYISVLSLKQNICFGYIQYRIISIILGTKHFSCKPNFYVHHVVTVKIMLHLSLSFF